MNIDSKKCAALALSGGDLIIATADVAMPPERLASARRINDEA